MTLSNSDLFLPAEWEKHQATWVAWPHLASDWPGKLPEAEAAYKEIIEALAKYEPVNVLCHDESIKKRAQEILSDVTFTYPCHLHQVPNNRSWLRDSAPIAVRTKKQELLWLDWQFNAWARYDNYEFDNQIGVAIAEFTGISHKQISTVLEGGMFDTDGEGTLLVTEECLLSNEQVRNPGYTREDYEHLFRKYFGVSKTLWLPGGIAGDDTHGHVDDVARFVAPGHVLLAFEDNPEDENYKTSQENHKYLVAQTDAAGRRLQITKLPMPSPIIFEGERMPASYANFYFANSAVLVPVFEDAKDCKALEIFSNLCPNHTIEPINCRDLIIGQGAIHCLTQQQPS